VDQSGRPRDARLRAAAGSLLFLFVAPGVVAGLVPWGLTGWEIARPPLIVAVVGYVILVAGVVVLLHAFFSGSSSRASARRRRSRRLATWSSAGCTATSATRCT